MNRYVGDIPAGAELLDDYASYAELPAAAKLLLLSLMLVGRLELYTILVLLFVKRRRA